MFPFSRYFDPFHQFNIKLVSIFERVKTSIFVIQHALLIEIVSNKTDARDVSDVNMSQLEKKKNSTPNYFFIRRSTTTTADEDKQK